jgi:N-acetyl-alpha-D-muramate 1-phosphate uridylyltransferase
MKAMILAAGRGQRMMPLTENTPKPLLSIAGKPLLQHHIEKLRRAGIVDLVINHCYLGEQIEAYFGDGREFGVHIQWSPEPIALETAGGLKQALSYLGEQPFISVNGDIWTDFDFASLRQGPFLEALEQNRRHAHLVLVDNPRQNPGGDFGLQQHKVVNQALSMWTYSGIALYHPKLIAKCPLGQPMGLAPILRRAIDSKLVSGEIYHGPWHDIGTPKRLAELEQQLSPTHNNP